MAPIGNAVFATLLMNDGYLPGAMVLGHSLKDRGAKGKLVALVLLDRLAVTTITELRTVYDDIVPVKQIMNKTPANLYLMNRPDLISTFTKIELWRQMQYSRIVYLDADMVSLRAPNELLTMDTHFAAVPDIGWPDCFNSGMMVLNPNMSEYYALLALAERGISFDGADQGLLNMHFTEWERLSFKYNCTPSGNYQYLPAYRHFQSSINMVHFIGKDKPWTLGRTSRKVTGIYAELMARWWAVYDRHYQAQETVYYPGKYQEAPKKVQDYVSGEETIYLPAYQRPKGRTSSSSGTSIPMSSIPVAAATAAAAASASMPTSQSQPSNNGAPPSERPAPAIEDSMGDQPAVDEQIQNQEFKPTPTAQQRRWSAPHAEWEPARAPPPRNAKPEAANFPTTVYEMSESKQLFQPPASYPEAPKDMWYQVPAKVPAPSKPKQIFPWESRAPKPTRVFAEPVLPSPPPEPLFPPDESDVPDTSASPSAPTESDVSSESTEVTREPYIDPWTTFNQRTNAWDEMPEITRYIQSINQAKKGKIQVLHHTPSTSIGPGSLMSPPIQGGRRDSARVTDFPTEYERPSLPVTPAPRRRTIWGEDRDEQSDLPGAEGVPRQAEWVRRFSSYPTPAFATALNPLAPELDEVLYFECQHCGKQNPVTKLDELQQRRQSEALLSRELSTLEDPPKREMPDSQSKEDVVKATEKALSPPVKPPLKPILKEPKFEIPVAAPVSEPEPAPEDTSKAVPAPTPASNIESNPVLASAPSVTDASAVPAAVPAVESESVSIPAPAVVQIPESVSAPEPEPKSELVPAPEPESAPEPAPVSTSVPESVPALAPEVIAAPPAPAATMASSTDTTSGRESSSIPEPIVAKEVLPSGSTSTTTSANPSLTPASAPQVIGAISTASDPTPTLGSSAVAAIAHDLVPSAKTITSDDNTTSREVLEPAPAVIAAPPAVPAQSHDPSLPAVSTSETLSNTKSTSLPTLDPVPAPSFIAAHPVVPESASTSTSTTAQSTESTQAPASISAQTAPRVLPFFHDAATIPYES